MAERVVDDREPIEIQGQDREGPALARGVPDRMGQPVGQQDAVRQPREGIVLGKVVDPRLGVLPFGYVTDDLGEPDVAPASSRIGSMTTLAQNRDSSFRTRQPSFSYRPVRSAVSRARRGSSVSRSSAV